MKLILTGKIAFFRKSEMTYVHVPNLPEFKVDDYAKKYYKDEKVWRYIPELVEFNKPNTDGM